MAVAQPTTPTEESVLHAARRIVEAFAATDTERYFSGFAPETSFVFHNEAQRLDNRAAYEDLWAGWVADGWKVLACESTNQLVTVFPGGAVFVHDLVTTVALPDGEDSYSERETIVFRNDDGAGLIAVHEHLSPMPAGQHG